MKNVSTLKRLFKLVKTTELIKDCPGCTNDLVDITNTHTPYYWIECNVCGLELHDARILVSRKDSLKMHKESFLHVIKKWNHLPR